MGKMVTASMPRNLAGHDVSAGEINRRCNRADCRRLHVGGAARGFRRANGGDPRTYKARREAIASCGATDLEPAGRLLIGAGCVETLETSAVSLGEFGPAPRFTAAITSGAIKMKDATCPALHAALQASEKGVPFMPLRGLIGSDVLKYRDDWKVIDSPFGNDDPIVLLPAIKPDVALDPRADGGSFRQCLDRAAARTGHHGARRRQDHRNRRKNSRRQPAGRSDACRRHAAGLLRRDASRSPSVAHGRSGCRIFMPSDADHLAEYARMAATTEGFAEYLERYVYERASPAATDTKRIPRRGACSPT